MYCLALSGCAVDLPGPIIYKLIQYRKADAIVAVNIIGDSRTRVTITLVLTCHLTQNHHLYNNFQDKISEIQQQR